jgi:rhodanese-related sulfurtransferase
LSLAAGCRPFWRRGDRPPFRKVAPAVAYEIARDTPDLLILDLRRPEEFQGDTGHIANARNIPLDRLPHRLLEISAFREETFLVYCREDDDCGAAGMALLSASGYADGILIDGGIDRWISDGFKTVITVDDRRRPAGPRP